MSDRPWNEVARDAQWELRRGSVVLGKLTRTDTDMPFVLCDWEPTPEYESVKPYFERLIAIDNEISQTDREARTKAFDKLGKTMWALGLTLVAITPAAEPILQLGEIGLRIQGSDASFRPSSMWYNVRSGAPWTKKQRYRLRIQWQRFNLKLRLTLNR